MADETQRPIVIKRIKKAAHGHHGGAWKIAYADFVTAMMAFFLLMWLLGSVNKAKLDGIAEYFKTPLRALLTGGEGLSAPRSLIKGGGEDITRKSGEVAKSDVEMLGKPRVEQDEKARLADLKAKLEKLIESNSKLQQFKNQIKLDVTREGLRVQIVDDQNRPMFDSGRAVMKPYTREILRAFGPILNEVPNRISLAGHTDAIQYQSGERGYSNWELSADRANAARRELVAGGLEEGHILRIVGLGSAVPFVKEDPNAPVNRRISIIVLNKKTEEAITREGQQIEARTATDLDRSLREPGHAQP